VNSPSPNSSAARYRTFGSSKPSLLGNSRTYAGGAQEDDIPRSSMYGSPGMNLGSHMADDMADPMTPRTPGMRTPGRRFDGVSQSWSPATPTTPNVAHFYNRTPSQIRKQAAEEMEGLKCTSPTSTPPPSIEPLLGGRFTPRSIDRGSLPEPKTPVSKQKQQPSDASSPPCTSESETPVRAPRLPSPSKRTYSNSKESRSSNRSSGKGGGDKYSASRTRKVSNSQGGKQLGTDEEGNNIMSGSVVSVSRVTTSYTSMSSSHGFVKNPLMDDLIEEELERARWSQFEDRISVEDGGILFSENSPITRMRRSIQNVSHSLEKSGMKPIKDRAVRDRKKWLEEEKLVKGESDAAARKKEQAMAHLVHKANIHHAAMGENTDDSFSGFTPRSDTLPYYEAEDMWKKKKEEAHEINLKRASGGSFWWNQERKETLGMDPHGSSSSGRPTVDTHLGDAEQGTEGTSPLSKLYKKMSTLSQGMMPSRSTLKEKERKALTLMKEVEKIGAEADQILEQVAANPGPEIGFIDSVKRPVANSSEARSFEASLQEPEGGLLFSNNSPLKSMNESMNKLTTKISMRKDRALLDTKSWLAEEQRVLDALNKSGGESARGTPPAASVQELSMLTQQEKSRLDIGSPSTRMVPTTPPADDKPKSTPAKVNQFRSRMRDKNAADLPKVEDDMLLRAADGKKRERTTEAQHASPSDGLRLGRPRPLDQEAREDMEGGLLFNEKAPLGRMSRDLQHTLGNISTKLAGPDAAVRDRPAWLTQEFEATKRLEADPHILQHCPLEADPRIPQPPPLKERTFLGGPEALASVH